MAARGQNAEVSWSEAEAELLAIWWQAGLKIPEMARRLKVPKQFLEFKCESLPSRNPQQARMRRMKEEGAFVGGHPPNEWTDWEDLILQRLRAEGRSYPEIGEVLKRSERTCCKRYGELRWRGKLTPEKRDCPACGGPVSRWNVSDTCNACKEAGSIVAHGHGVLQ